jgi:hypothetical protein
MTTTQFFILLGTIWIAPHANTTYGRAVGLGLVFIAMLMEALK